MTGKAKGQSEKEFDWVDGQSGDRYLTLLRGIARNLPKTSLSLNDLKDRVAAECRGDGPQSGNITNDIGRISK